MAKDNVVAVWIILASFLFFCFVFFKNYLGKHEVNNMQSYKTLHKFYNDIGNNRWNYYTEISVVD